MEISPVVVAELERETIYTSKTYGAFGCVVRMQDEFDHLKTLFGGRRRVKTTKAIHASLRRIAANALVAMSIEGEPQ